MWGFIFGIAGAFLIKFLKIEKKFVAPKVEAQTTYVNKSFVAYEEAMQLLTAGDKDNAYIKLMESAKEDPTNQDVIETLWNIAPEIGKTSEVAPLLTRLIEREIQQAKLKAALFHYKHLRSKVPDTRFSTHTKIMIFEQSVNVKDLEEAKILYRELLKEVNLASPPGLVLELCTAALKFDLNFDKSLANKVIELARQHPEVPENRKESLKQQLYAIPKQKKDAPIKVDSHYDYDFPQLDSKGDMGGVKGASSVSGASSLIVPLVPTAPTTPSASQEPAIPVTPSQSQPPPIPIEPVIPIDPQEPEIPLIIREPKIPITPSQSQPPPPAPRKSLRVTKAVPLGVKGGKIALNIENMGQRIFALEKIKMIAVVKISPPGERPFLLIDLFVDDPGAPTDPTAQEDVICTLRLLSTNFNPQKFVAGAQGPLESFKIFTSALLKLSKAKPFPDMESVQLKKVAGYRSINEYENSLLSADGT